MQICSLVDLGCEVCFKGALQLSTSMNVVAGLTPASTPYLWITDKFGNQYKDQISVAGDGSFNILTALYPAGMFNIYAGNFDIFVSSDKNGLIPLDMTFESKTYKCLKISVYCGAGGITTDDGVSITTDDGIEIIAD